MGGDCRQGTQAAAHANSKKPAMLKTTYTLGEAADLLSCHKETLRRAIMEGSLQAARLGRGYRISRLDLEAFWTARGGGELFSREEIEASKQDELLVQREKKLEKESRLKPPPGPTQLLLPTGR